MGSGGDDGDGGGGGGEATGARAVAAALGAALMPMRGWGGGDTAGAAGAWKPAACLDEGCNERPASKVVAL